MAKAISISVGVFGFFSALAAGGALAALFPSAPVVSAVAVDEVGVAAFLIGPSAAGDAVATVGGVTVVADGADFCTVVVFGSSVAVVLVFMMWVLGLVKEPLPSTVFRD